MKLAKRQGLMQISDKKTNGTKELSMKSEQTKNEIGGDARYVQDDGVTFNDSNQKDLTKVAPIANTNKMLNDVQKKRSR